MTYQERAIQNQRGHLDAKHGMDFAPPHDPEERREYERAYFEEKGTPAPYRGNHAKERNEGAQGQ